MAIVVAPALRDFETQCVNAGRSTPNLGEQSSILNECDLTARWRAWIGVGRDASASGITPGCIAWISLIISHGRTLEAAVGHERAIECDRINQRDVVSAIGIQALKGQTVTASRQRNRSSRSEEHTSELQSPCNLVC